jgi:hypothetical protein
MTTEVKPKIEACVQKKNPLLKTFKLPDTPEIVHDKYGYPGPSLALSPLALVTKKLTLILRDFHEGMIDFSRLGTDVLNPSVCPTPEARLKAKTCILAVEEKTLPKYATCTSPMKMTFEFLQVRDQFCVKRTECEKPLTEPCSKLAAQLPAILCTCAEAYMNDNWDPSVAELKTCINRKLPEPVTLPAALIAPQGTLKNMAKNMLKKKCEEAKKLAEGKPDPCAADFNPFDLISGKTQTAFKLPTPPPPAVLIAPPTPPLAPAPAVKPLPPVIPPPVTGGTANDTVM